MKYRLSAVSTALVISLITACGGDDAPSSTDGGGDAGADVTSDATLDQTTDAGGDGPTDAGDDADDTGAGDVSDDDGVADRGGDSQDSGADAEEPDGSDLGADDVADTGGDPGVVDASDLGDTGGSGFPTLFDYRPCDVDVDCPVGLGNCITEIVLNREDSELGTRVDVLELIPDWPADGVCSLGCTTDPTVCETLSLRDNLGREVEWSCQVVVEGDSPYPDPVPPFPFADQLTPADLAAGVPFGAVCRPPFRLDRDRSNTFCQACEGDAECAGDDVCWDFGAELPDAAEGVCLETCTGDGDCPLGFACDELRDGDDALIDSFCVPTNDTCTDCRDLDGDGRGVGFCGPTSAPVSSVDCDDLNADLL